jgi:hypothetical protein
MDWLQNSGQQGGAPAGTTVKTVSDVIKGLDTTPPTTTIQCNGGACSSSTYFAPVSVALSATDNSGGTGVDKTYYTTDGSTPTTGSPVYSGPFTVSATTTVKFFSTDVAGNAETPQSQLIPVNVDNTPPTTSMTCNATLCSNGWYQGSVTVRLSATDNAGGSGVDKTYYTTDGSTPTTGSPVYTGPFTVSQTTTVRFFSTDVAGNAETPKSRLIQIDVTAPSVSITSPVNNASFARGSKVTITASASDSTGSGASGIANVAFFVDGKRISSDSSSPYSASWNTSGDTRGFHTLTAVATDVAGNSTTSAPITVRIT